MTDSDNGQGNDTATTLSLSVQLSHEELSIILGLMNTNGLPGYRSPVAVNREVAEAITRSLYARQIIGRDGDTVLLDEQVVGLVGAGTVAERGLLVERINTNNPNASHWYYLPEDVIVHHYAPYAGVHRFETLPSGMALLASLTDVMQMRLERDPEHAPAGEAQDIPTDVYQTARDQIQAGHSTKAAAALRSTNLAEAAVNALIAPQARTLVTLAFLTAANGRVQASGMLILHVEDGCWMVLPQGDFVTFAPLSDQHVLDQVAALMNAPLAEA
jgi:hypothetical protein